MELSAPGKKHVFKITLLEEVDAPARRVIRVNLEVNFINPFTDGAQSYR